jgi:hypothetical protein
MPRDILEEPHQVVRLVRARHEQLGCLVKLLSSWHEKTLSFVFFPISNMRVRLKWL